MKTPSETHFSLWGSFCMSGYFKRDHSVVETVEASVLPESVLPDPTKCE